MPKTNSKKPYLYTTSKLTKNSDANLWVTFETGNIENGFVFSSIMSRDSVRNKTRQILGLNKIHDIRSCRVRNYRKRLKSSSKATF